MYINHTDLVPEGGEVGEFCERVGGLSLERGNHRAQLDNRPGSDTQTDRQTDRHINYKLCVNEQFALIYL